MSKRGGRRHPGDEADLTSFTEQDAPSASVTGRCERQSLPLLVSWDSFRLSATAFS